MSEDVIRQEVWRVSIQVSVSSIDYVYLVAAHDIRSAMRVASGVHEHKNGGLGGWVVLVQKTKMIVWRSCLADEEAS